MEYFVTKFDESVPAGAKRAVVDDSIMIKGSPAAAGSKIFGNFISPVEAEAVRKLKAAGIVIAGRTLMNEFGTNGLFELKNSKYGLENSLERLEIVNSGAVAAVAENAADFALCNDYTGAVSLEAAEHGLYYIHPTYGTVSRYGLIPSVQSMDQIGVVCRSPSEGFQILEIISGHDPKDGAMIDPDCASGRQEMENVRLDGADIKIGIPSNIENGLWESATAVSLLGFAPGVETVDTELKHFEYCNPVMQILCCAELSNNISRYDGIKFGYRAEGYGDLRELYTKTRSAFGPHVKLAAMAGALVLSHDNYLKFYDKAMRVRRLIRDSLEFNKYDAIVVPTPGIARLCGIPAVTMPLMTIAAAPGREDILMAITGNK
ncbi:MAG: amidase family protein [Oscillospiraceae bacterium]|nr:amidase family protein [Oscillospiraceae bacterium]